jgi:drug/metabolite transporter (DMT)-like permease
VDAAFWGAMSALSFGCADFIARFTSQRLGTARSLLGVLAIGLLPILAHVIGSDAPLTWPDAASAWLVVIYGLATALATLLLYEGLARGPITVVAPIVAGYPALVVALALLMGRNPGALHWAAMLMVLAGVLITARFVKAPVDGTRVSRSTLAIAVAASVSYAGLVAAAQAVVPVLGEASTALSGRLVAIVALLAAMGLGVGHVRPARGLEPVYPLLGLQGLLDGGGHLLLFAGSHGAYPEVAAVAGSCFGAVTTLLAYFILRERVTAPQWGGIALVFVGVASLSWPH